MPSPLLSSYFHNPLYYSRFIFRSAGDSVELTVGNEATVKVLNDLYIDLTDKFLDNWPEPDVCKLPDMKQHDGFFGKVLVANEEKPTPIEEVTCVIRKEKNSD